MFWRTKTNKPLKIDWKKRRGTVISIARVMHNVTVLWDDRTSVDQWPIRAVEKVGD
jgi:hypothetical protein